MKIEVSGVKFDLDKTLIKHKRGHRLHDLCHFDADQGTTSTLNIQRSPACFEAILGLYQTGSLHIPLSVCPGAFKEELDYWRIDISELSECCSFRYFSFLEKQHTRRSFLQRTNVSNDETNKKMYKGLFSFLNQTQKKKKELEPPVLKCLQSVGRNVWRVVSLNTNTFPAKVYCGLVFLMVMVSIAALALSTEPSWRRNVSDCELLEYMEHTSSNQTDLLRTHLGNPDCSGHSRFLSIFERNDRTSTNVLKTAAKSALIVSWWSKQLENGADDEADNSEHNTVSAEDKTKLNHTKSMWDRDKLFGFARSTEPTEDTTDISTQQEPLMRKKRFERDTYLHVPEAESDTSTSVTHAYTALNNLLSETNNTSGNHSEEYLIKSRQIRATHSSSNQARNFSDSITPTTFHEPNDGTAPLNSTVATASLLRDSNPKEDIIFTVENVTTTKKFHPNINPNLSFREIPGQPQVQDVESIEISNGTQLQIPVITVPMLSIKILELLVIVFFTLDLILRLLSCPSIVLYFCRFTNILDAFALLASLAYFMIVELFRQYKYTETTWLSVISYVQVFRAFRLFGIVKNLKTCKVLIYSLSKGVHDMVLIALLLGVCIGTFACLFYFAESGKSVGSIPHAWYWAVITMTTVGYGDVTPTTGLGHFIAGLCAITGVALFAITLPLFVNNFILFYKYACVNDRAAYLSDRFDNSKVERADQDETEDVAIHI
ncbi:KCNAB-like protein [Mya arenaria]|uniref:KCNAB-like protein n=1 Tax=Mya arenaria TaxID=6604 RepID=A0ABY7F207_MYAAR|nr:KCNAB-like protein [Mya arenaria]